MFGSEEAAVESREGKDSGEYCFLDWKRHERA